MDKITQPICGWINDLVDQGNEQAADIKDLSDRVKVLEGGEDCCHTTYAGNNPPDSCLGKAGDTYIQLTKGEVYMKTSGGWESKGVTTLDCGTF